MSQTNRQQFRTIHTEPLSELFQRRLARFNQGRLAPQLPAEDWEDVLGREHAVRCLEGRYIESERAAVRSLVEQVPTEAEPFVEWFEALKQVGPGQGDPLFSWLAEHAPLTQMRWFLTQEVAGEAGFDDLVALTQIQLPPQPKLELARNYWDEMGRGREEGMHGLLLNATISELQLEPSMEKSIWESLALANLMIALASHRSYAYLSIGALGAVELTAPGRVSLVNKGMERLGISVEGRRYFQLHAGLDVRHSEAWNKEALIPLVRDKPDCARHIAEGALLRLRAGERCFRAYRAHLAVSAGSFQKVA